MGIASNLFHSSDTEKQTLHRRIIPSDEQQQSQQERWKDVAEYLIDDLSAKSGYSISSWLQGSYKFETQIRPSRKGEEFDIDVGIYFNWPGNPTDGKYTPKQFKDFVQTSLKGYAEETGEEVIELVDPAKNRCSRIRFSGDFHIDIPCYHIDPEKDVPTLATEENKWENSDPKTLFEWFQNKASLSDDGQLRRLVRYFKMWAARNFKEDERPSTILLTVLMTNVFSQLSINEKDGDDSAFKASIEKVITNLSDSSVISNPVSPSENLNRMEANDFILFTDKLKQLLDIASRALRSTSQFESATIWQEVFHHFFPIPVVEEGNKKNLALVPVQFEPQVSIKATPLQNKNRPYLGVNEIGPIPKECKLEFTITNSHLLPNGAQIEWIARNEGQDAEYENDLGHFAGKGIQTFDGSAYKGTHFMDVVIKSPYGSILGFRRIPVHVTGMVMPPRNPKRKPGYFRSRRR